ncbi:MAG TPA: thiamine phosphate synthase [Burkholderiales bacterium]
MISAAARIRGLYAIADTGYLDDARLLPAVDKALRAGASVIQYRDKTHEAAARERQARQLRERCSAFRACYIVNDDAELARAVAADGLHLGREDASIEAARSVLPAGAIIGVSCYDDLARAEAMVSAGADYVAFGSFYPSRTKPRAVRANLELLRAARARLPVPLVAIGGITPENGGALINAGADALAVISGVFDQPDVEATARRYTELFTKSGRSN